MGVDKVDPMRIVNIYLLFSAVIFLVASKQVPSDSNGDQGHLSSFRMIGRPKLGPLTGAARTPSDYYGSNKPWDNSCNENYDCYHSTNCDCVPYVRRTGWCPNAHLAHPGDDCICLGGTSPSNAGMPNTGRCKKIRKPKECRRIADCFRKEICGRFTKNCRCQENYCVFQEIPVVLN